MTFIDLGRSRWSAMCAILALVAALAPTVPRVTAEQSGSRPGYHLAVWGDGAAGPLGTTACCALRTVPVAVPGAGQVTAAVPLANGGTMVARSDGTVWEWGNLALGKVTLLPRKVSGLSRVVALAGGSGSMLALETDGSVWSWGSDSPVLGREAPTEAQAGAPGKVRGLNHIVRIAAGGGDALATTADGHIYSWGINSVGEVGDGTRAARRTPVRVEGLANVISAATSGQVAVAAERDGSVWAWGNDAPGSASIPGMIHSSVPVHLSGLPPVTRVAAEGSGLGLARDGSVWTLSRSSRVAGLHDVTVVASGLRYNLAIERDGTVWSWEGGSAQGPVREPGLQGAVAVAAAEDERLALVSAPPPEPGRARLGSCTRTSPDGTLVLGSHHASLAVDQRTGHVFVASSDAGGIPPLGTSSPTFCAASVSTLDGRTGRLLRTVLLGQGTATFARSPLQNWSLSPVLALDGSHLVAVYEPSLESEDTAGGISIIDTATGNLVRSESVGYEISGVAADSVSHGAFVPYTDDMLGAHLAVVQDTGGRTRREPLPWTGFPIVDGPAGRLFLVTDMETTTIAVRTGRRLNTQWYNGGQFRWNNGDPVGLWGLDERRGRLFLGFGAQFHRFYSSLQLLDSHTGKLVRQLGFAHVAGQPEGSEEPEPGPITVDAPVGRVLIPQLGPNLTTVRDASTGRILRSLTLVLGHSAVDSRTGRVYALTDGSVPGNSANTVTVLDPRGWRVVAMYHLGGKISDIALDERSNRVFAVVKVGSGTHRSLRVRSFCIAGRCG